MILLGNVLTYAFSSELEKFAKYLVNDNGIKS